MMRDEIKNASVPRNLNACFPIIYFSVVGKRGLRLPIVGPSTEVKLLNGPEPKTFLDLIARNPRWYIIGRSKWYDIRNWLFEFFFWEKLIRNFDCGR